MWNLSFISEQDFKEHVRLTIQQYGNKLAAYDLHKFNKNTIDPIKLIFDKMVYRYSWEEIIKNEISRQRDKSNNNDIGYFHQRIFRYMDCDVPDTGWDVIFKKDSGISLPGGDTVKTVFVEMKNKHNTMNSASASKTYKKMQDQILEDDKCACFLVEAIAKKSQNIIWAPSLGDGKSGNHCRIRQVSMDEFYKLVTGQDDAFYQMCMVLPSVIEQVVAEAAPGSVPQDTVIEELRQIAEPKNGSLVLALYMLGFKSYNGFVE
jgi:hypothetical protein